MAGTRTIKSGERRNAAILFADLQGFTALSEHMDPEEIDALMSRVFGAFEEIITARGGIVEKYIGDALVAVFGVPELHEDDPQRALESALAFLERNKNNTATGARNSVSLSFRIGIHSGLIATGDRGAYKVVTGHPMAIAQRIQAAAAPGSVFVSEAVKERCEGDYEFEGPIPLEAKGISEDLRAWKLIGAAQAGAGDTGPFIGREDELAELLRLYVRHDPSQSSGVYLVAEAGMGKTRLAHAFAEKIKKFPDFSSPTFSARAQKYRPMRYAVIADLLLEYFDLEPSSNAEAVIKAVSALPATETIHAQRFASLLEPTDNPAKDADIVLSLFTIFSAIHEKHKKAVYPAFLYIDNAQAMDRSSCEFLAYYLKNSKYKPFVLMAARDQAHGMRSSFAELKTMKLGPLDRAESIELAKVHWPHISQELLDAIIKQSGGKPLFVREYALFAKKHKNVSSLPGSIQNMFLASLDKYEPAVKDFAKAMSVFVLNFDELEARSVYEAAGGSGEAVKDFIKILCDDGIFVQHGKRYTFATDVFKKALYATILNHNKKILHGVVADSMLAGIDNNKLRLIYHLVKAERWPEAAHVIQSDSAKNYSYEYLEYIDTLYKRLIKQAPDTALRLLITKSSLYFNSGKIDEAEGELKRVMRVALSERNELCMAFAYQMICAHNVMSSSFYKARHTGQKALYYYKRVTTEPRSIQNVMMHLAMAEVHLNNFEAASAIAAEMNTAAHQNTFDYKNTLAFIKLYSGDYKTALAIIDSKAVPHEHESDFFFSPVTQFFDMDTKLRILWQLCDFDAIIPAVETMLDSGDYKDDCTARAQAMLAVSATMLGGAKASDEAFMQAEYYTDKIHNDFDKVESLQMLASCYFIAGHIRKAESAAREALITGLRHSCYYSSFTVLMILVEIADSRGNKDEARFFLAEASHLFSTGLLLPAKDVILYYYYADKLSEPSASPTNAVIALKLLLTEKSRIGTPELVTNFLSIRGFAAIESYLETRHT